MSWESISSRDYLGGSASHQLSATALLGSPDGSRHPLDVCEFTEEDYRHQNGNGNNGHYQNGRSGAGLWECLISCRKRLDQQLARRRVEQGLKLYRAHKQQAAVRKWRGALKSIRHREDKFALLGYLYQAYMDWGKYRDSIEFGNKQLCISEELDSPNMRAEAYLNLARAHERLGALDRALDYARHSLYNECDQCATAGLVHLTVGRVHLELAGFCKALEAFQRAHKIAHSIQDPSLELQVYVGLSELFCRLQDADKSARYAARAYDLSRSLQLGDLNSRHHRAALLQMAAALRKKGELGDAHDYCSEATRLSLVSGDQASYARSIRIMGDIYRKKSDINIDFLSAFTSSATMLSEPFTASLFVPTLLRKRSDSTRARWARRPRLVIDYARWKRWTARRDASKLSGFNTRYATADPSSSILGSWKWRDRLAPSF
ncbi:43 kDa receptor-associated protein of the synapse homolog isoform X3 [Solenopsis invicta]|uniref:43 kDa receptor-associated protein of the synapse homolog isoform X3 n=1 Tax=Solenopsis invicta TaxID=13686 RepID=UPI000E33DD40|nr:43 kDa receptor-associated protein of the synapse homolog isoform X3 [Solenopsis invicta]